MTAPRLARWLALILSATALFSAPLVAAAASSAALELAFHRGVVAFGQGKLDQAREAFQEVLAEDPDATAALQYLGLIAQRQDDHAAAVAAYDRALEIDPQAAAIHLDRGIALLAAGRLEDARAGFERAIALDPGNARAELFAGVAAYRMSAYAEATPHFERAAALDASLRDEAHYYTGICQALAGNIEAATAALGEVEAEAPLSPLERSAQNLREQLRPAPGDRRWYAAFTAGMEWDDNPLIAGTNAVGVPVDSADGDFRGVLRPRARYRFLQGESYSLTGGYDGYLGLQIQEKQIDLQVHNPWISAGYQVGPVQLALRGDYSYTMNDLTEPFRHQVRATPSLSFQPADWGLTQVFYQFSWKDFLVDSTRGTPLDRDGTRHVGGLNQLFFLPEPYTFVRVGAYADFNNSQGSEWGYDGMEANFGVGYDFDWDIALSWLYRFQYRSYDDPSLFSSPAPYSQIRIDYRHILSAELAKGLTEHWQVSVSGAFSWNASSVEFYDYSRHIVGTYVTYRF